MGSRQGGWQVPAPRDEALIRWPEAFGTRFTVIVDVEEEFDWSRPLARTGHATTAAVALPDAARRFGDRGAGLVLAASYPIVADPPARDALRAATADGRSTIEAQLHAWTTPPYDEPLTPANSFAGNLPRALEAAKIDAITDAIGEAFGRRPMLFRAGRYGIGPNTAALLAARGYRIDASTRARYDYSGEGGPDFSALGNAAYRLGELVELPFSTVFTGAARRWGPPLYRQAKRVPRGPGVLARSGLLSRVSLTPEGMPLAEVLEAVRIALGEGERLLQFAFHSPSLVPGHTPFVRDAADLAAFWRWWDAVLNLLARRGVTFAGVEAIAEAACDGGAAPVSQARAGGL